ncbi:MAG: ABC-F family ATP-binding cassette domain-containing protein [Lachnospiraceae bacterium]|jgi:ATP-binding cassette subfamily F protein 3|nr:ABC-F family ATP-binding cassette domain-containing protein [Lachnospiraceae bacterium]
MILSCQNITKTFDGKTILKQANFHIEDHEKAAMIGINGAGKTTLLNIITGRLQPDEGVISISKGKTIGYLEQNPVLDSEKTIFDELMSVKDYLLVMEQDIRQMEQDMKHREGSALTALMDQYSRLTTRFEMENGYACKSELTGILKGLGFEESEYDKPVRTLSGGQKTRVALGKLLLLSPDIILLDEPTNHLDMHAVRWLEGYLSTYKGAVLIVSHDRYFLDRIATKIIEIDAGTVMTFAGNYSVYARKKEQYRADRMHAYLNQQREIKHQQEVIDKLKSFNREKSIKRAESREKMLARIEVLEKPTEVNTDMHIRLIPGITSGKDVLDIEDLSKAFGPEVLFRNISFSLKRGEHVAIIGNNGTGKTTLLKLVNELLPADKGTIRLGTNVHIGYYDQEHHVLHGEKSIYDELSDEYPALTTTQIRNILAAFLFTGDDVFKLIRECSGGERGRISLAKLMLSEANFLILDEPTNHLDIASREILEDALNEYEGTVLYVSHDRYFINRTAHRILELSGHDLIGYLGNYDYYVEKKAETGTTPFLKEAAPSTASSSKADWQAKKALQAKRRKLENDLKKTEEKITELEEKIADLDVQMASDEICRNSAKLGELTATQETMKKELEVLYETWEELSEQI